MKVSALLLSLFCLCFSATYYVSPTGDNGNPGTFSLPWRHPGYGSKQIQSGDTLVIFSGVYDMFEYWDDMITPPSGSSLRPTVVIGQGPTKPVLRGGGSIYSCVDLSDSSYIVIKNLEITSLIDTPYTGGARVGISAGGDFVHHLAFEDIHIHRVEDMGINLAGDAEHITIKRCSIHHCANSGIGGPAPMGSGWRNVLVDSCYIGWNGHYWQGRDTISEWERPDGVGMEASEGPLEIRYTTSEHNLGDGLDSKSKRTYIHHCVVANNYGDGVKLWGDSSYVENTLIYGTGDGVAESTPWCLLVIDSDDNNAYFEITNVTMWDSPDRPPHYAGTIQYDNDAVPATVRMRNVIISANRQLFVRPIVSFLANNNLFFIDEDVQVHANGTDYTSSNIGSLGSGNIYGNPQFVEPHWGTTGNFHVQVTSPAVNTGMTVPSITDDLDFNPRPCGSAYDIGAYERCDGSIISFSDSVEAPTVLFLPGKIQILSDDVRCIALYDLGGRQILFSSVNVGKSVDTDLPNGLYFLKVMMDSMEMWRKIVLAK